MIRIATMIVLCATLLLPSSVGLAQPSATAARLIAIVERNRILAEELYETKKHDLEAARAQFETSKSKYYDFRVCSRRSAWRVFLEDAINALETGRIEAEALFVRLEGLRSGTELQRVIIEATNPAHQNVDIDAQYLRQISEYTQRMQNEYINVFYDTIIPAINTYIEIVEKMTVYLNFAADECARNVPTRAVFQFATGNLNEIIEEITGLTAALKGLIETARGGE